MRYNFASSVCCFIYFLFASCVAEKGTVEQGNELVHGEWKDSVNADINPPGDSNLLPSGNGAAYIENHTKGKGDLSALQFFKGKYPYEIKLLKNPALKTRLRELLGTELYAYVKQIRQVESPIEIEDGLFYSWAMQAHSGGNPSAVIMIDFEKDILYVGIRKNNISTLYSEDGSAAPQKLNDWSNEPTFEELIDAGVFN